MIKLDEAAESMLDDAAVDDDYQGYRHTLA
jgi:hypothetical protein